MDPWVDNSYPLLWGIRDESVSQLIVLVPDPSVKGLVHLQPPAGHILR